MGDYLLTTPDVEGPVQRTADSAFIPNDPLNADWIKYRDWRALGNTPDPFVPVPGAPDPRMPSTVGAPVTKQP